MPNFVTTTNTVTVIGLNGETVCNEVHVGKTPDQILVEIAEAACVLVDKVKEYRLQYNGRTLLGSKTLKEQVDIESGLQNVLQIIEEPMEIFIKDIQGKHIRIQTSGSNTIRDVKQKFQKVSGIQAGEQRFLYEGQQLADNKTLNDYKVRHNASMQCSMRLSGGSAMN